MVGPVHQWLNPATHGGVALLDRMVNQQAQIVAYVDDYVLLIMTTLPALLLLLLMRMPRKAAPVETEVME
jgi:DHA2 family multidrug resistance protein